jgi:hypothetical protein
MIFGLLSIRSSKINETLSQTQNIKHEGWGVAQGVEGPWFNSLHWERKVKAGMKEDRQGWKEEGTVA